MGILDSKEIIKGVSPVKIKPTNRGFDVDKSKPLGKDNFPLSTYTTWKANCYTKDAAGIRRTMWLEKTLPTGIAFRPMEVWPQIAGVIEVKSYQHGKLVHCQKKNRRIPELEP